MARASANGAGKVQAWADLRLPLYRRAVAAEFGDAVACGLLSICRRRRGDGGGDVGRFLRETQAAAERCAEGVIAAVVAGEFWPPRELKGREAGGGMNLPSCFTAGRTRASRGGGARMTTLRHEMILASAGSERRHCAHEPVCAGYWLTARRRSGSWR